MKVCIVSGSIREENTTRIVAKKCIEVAEEKHVACSLVSLIPFDTFFSGKYVTFESSTPEQHAELTKMREAEVLLFIVPTYYKSMPGVLKNFFDMVRTSDIYTQKTIGFISSNQKNQDYGAQHTRAVIQGLLTFFNVPSVIVPEILIQDHEKLNPLEIERFLKLLEEYRTLFRKKDSP